MQKVGRGVGKASVGVAVLALAALTVVYAAEIVAFLGRNAWWIVGGLVLWTAVSVVLGVTIGRMLRRSDLREPGLDPALPAKAADVVEIPSPSSPHDSEQGGPLRAPTRRWLTRR